MSSRDKFLMMLMPGLIVMMIYGVAFVSFKQRAMNKLEGEVTTARAKSPGPERHFARQSELLIAQKQLKALLAEEADLHARWDAIVKSCRTIERRSDRVAKLVEILQAKNVHVVTHVHAEEDKEGKPMKMSASQDRLAKLLVERDKLAPQLWRFQVVGRFTDLVAALETLTTGDVVAIPLSVAMKETTSGSQQREWSLLLWM